MSEIKLDKLQNALKSLELGFKNSPSELERDGIIQRFEFSVELSWKAAQRVLVQNGITTDVPKNVFRELAKIGWIDNPEIWIEFIDARNKASHIYNEDMAKAVFACVKVFIPEAKKLLSILEKKVK